MNAREPVNRSALSINERGVTIIISIISAVSISVGALFNWHASIETRRLELQHDLILEIMKTDQPGLVGNLQLLRELRAINISDSYISSLSESAGHEPDTIFLPSLTSQYHTISPTKYNLISRINDVERGVRLAAVAEIIGNYSSDEEVLALLIDELLEHRFRLLSPSGRINLFVILNNMNWSGDDAGLRLAEAAMDRLRFIQENSSNYQNFGDQSHSALSNLINTISRVYGVDFQ